ncbi:MAG: class I SAM-dependent methyltransferase [Prevotella sp.]|nr:class I SAM-dependent methyltransferase [Prevotella sp.]MCM1074052.1 class I SAM-dependent methyltransferase [Ruminococcus sp.]
MIISDATKTFIAEHINENAAKLRLKYFNKQLPEVDIPLAITQIEARQKVQRKFGKFLDEHPDILFPDTLSAEQCSAPAVAEYRADVVSEQDSVLDLTCGLGIDALSLARVSRQLTACDIDSRHVDCFNRNAAYLNLKHTKAIHCEAGDFLSSLPEDTKFSLIFADPARRNKDNRRTYALADCTPDVLSLTDTIKCHTNRLLLKVSPMLDVAKVLDELPEVAAVHAVSLRGECKELMLDCRFDIKQCSRTFSAVDIRSNGSIVKFEFTETEVIDNMPVITSLDDVQPGYYLYEPNPSIMKFIGCAPLAAHFPTLRKLGKNTHLYISDKPLGADMPGRLLKIEKVLTPSKKIVSQLPEKVNIVTRNYPDSPEILKRKLKLKDGGDKFLYAGRLLDSTPRLLLCQPALAEF